MCLAFDYSLQTIDPSSLCIANQFIELSFGRILVLFLVRSRDTLTVYLLRFLIIKGTKLICGLHDTTGCNLRSRPRYAGEVSA